MDARLIADIDSGRRRLWRDATPTECMLLQHTGYADDTDDLRTLVLRPSPSISQLRWPALELAAAQRHITVTSPQDDPWRAAAAAARQALATDPARWSPAGKQ